MSKPILRVIESNDVDAEVEAVINELRKSYQTEEEVEFFSETVVVKKVKKGTILLREGQSVKASFFVCKGCVREYYLKDGEDRTVAFYTEGESIRDDEKKATRSASSVTWECVTDCIVTEFQFEDELEMFRRFPRIEAICRIETEKEFARYKDAMVQFLASSPEERYLHLLNTKPHLFQLVPLYQIASYLGVKPESLSRIRNRLRAS